MTTYKSTIVAILLRQRNDSAVQVQKILTGWGCMIKTRLGLHEDILDDCSQRGLIMLEMIGEDEKVQELVRKLNVLPHVSANKMVLELEDED